MKKNAIRFGRPSPRKPASSNAPFTVDIERLSHDGRGVARLNGKTIFIEGVLPGETVIAKVTQTHKRFDEASVQSIVTPSSERVSPTCEHYEDCGGCQLQHLATAEQIRYKEENVLSLLQRMSSITPAQIDAPILSDAFGYRRSARVGLNVLQRNDEVIAGFRRRQSNKLLPIKHCPVLSPRLDGIFTDLQKSLSTLSNPKQLTHAEVQLGDAGITLTLRCKGSLKSSDKKLLSAWAEQKAFNLFIQTDTKTLNLHQQHDDYYQLLNGNLRLDFASGDFLQVNPAVNDKMIDQALSWLALDKSDNVLDLFCGLGNFTLPIAPYVNHIIGVEGIEKMVAQATANATRNKLTNAQFFRADLSKDLSSETWLNQPINKIILDPPRTGAYELLKQLPATATDILYVSCEPSALARDAELLTQKGYSMVRFGVMDMFPQTNHVESMALFQKTTKGKSS